MMFEITDGSSVKDKLKQLKGNPGALVCGTMTDS